MIGIGISDISVAASARRGAAPLEGGYPALPVPTLLDALDTLENWSIGQSGGASALASAELDNTHHVEGTGAIAVTASVGGNNNALLTSAPATRNVPELGVVIVYGHLLERSGLTSIGHQLLAGPTQGVVRWANAATSFCDGGRWYAFHVEELRQDVLGADEDQWRHRLIADGEDPGAGRIVWDAIYANAAGRPTTTIWLDDGYASQHDVIVPMLEARGLRATIGVDRQAVLGQSPTFMRLEALQDLYARGHDVAVHGGSSWVDDGVGEAVACRQWLIDNGMPRAAHIAAYPGGVWSQSLVDALRDAGFALARTVEPQGFYTRRGWFGQEMTFPSFGLSAATSLEDVGAALDKAERRGECQSLHLHDVAEGEAQYLSLSQGWLAELFDHIAARVEARRLTVLTASELYADPVRA